MAMRSYMDKFQKELAKLAGNLASTIVHYHRHHLTKELLALAIKARKAKISKTQKNVVTKVLSEKDLKLARLKSRAGKWKRDADFYKVISIGDSPGSYKLRNIRTGKTIISNGKTILARWKYEP